MRILHTSDWHIGIVCEGYPLLSAQEWVLDVIAGIVERCGIDVVVVSGDVYDKTEPTEAEIEVCHNAFREINDAGAQLVVIPGNHDSAVRLGAGQSFTAAEGLHLSTRIDTIGQPVLIDDEYGPVAFYAIPCLGDAQRELGLPPGAAATAHPQDLLYAEGFATPSIASVLPLEHAWCVAPDGSVVDPTWDTADVVYFGVVLADSGTLPSGTGGLLSDFDRCLPLPRDGVPAAVLASVGRQPGEVWSPAEA